MLIATGQYEIDLEEEEDDDMMFELRDMSSVVKEILSIEKVWMEEKNVTDTVSKNRLTLTTKGATKFVMLMRNFNKESDIAPDDISIPLLTGFTKKAVKHSIKYCTRIFWKILTDIWWDEDDEEDMALPIELEHYDSVKQRRRRHSRQRSSKSMPGDVKRQLSQTSISSLFGILLDHKTQSYDEEEEEPSSYQNDNFLKVG